MNIRIISCLLTLPMLVISCETDNPIEEIEKEDDPVITQLPTPNIYDATDILAKYNNVDLHWDHIFDAVEYKIILNDTELPSTTETSLRLDNLAEGDHCLQVKAISADTTLFYDSEWSSFNFTIDEDKIKGFKFDFEILRLSSDEVSYRITPGNLNATYYYQLTEKSLFDLYGENNVRSFVYIQHIEYMRKWFDMLIVSSGVRERQQGIKPGVEYMILAYGLKEDGTVTTSFQYTTFTSPSE